jgi:phage-related baseplate assembly protein
MAISIVEDLTYTDILDALITTYQLKNEDYEPHESDDIMPLLELFAYREVEIRAYLNSVIKRSFWQTATGSDLDFIAEFFGVFRLSGSKPTAQATLTLTSVLSYSYTVPAGIQVLLNDETIAILINDVIFEAGAIEAIGLFEYQSETRESNASFVEILTPKPYLKEIIQTTLFVGGGDVESDEAVRRRIALSFDEQTTAGSKNSYKQLALKADSRIKDVVIQSLIDGIVDIGIWSDDAVDSAMLERVLDSCNDETQRPLTDRISVRVVESVLVEIQVNLILKENVDSVSIRATVIETIEDYMKDMRIGESLTISKIIRLSSVDGVEDVEVVSPTQSVIVAKDVVIKGNGVVVNV